MKLELTHEECELTKTAVSMYKNWLTTGSVLLSVGDVQNMGEEVAKAHGAQIQPLTDAQMRRVLSLSTLLDKLFAGW